MPLGNHIDSDELIFLNDELSNDIGFKQTYLKIYFRLTSFILSLFIVCLKYTGVQLFNTFDHITTEYKSDKQVADNKCHMLLQLIMEQAYLLDLIWGSVGKCLYKFTFWVRLNGT
ncbi:hypothetical protein ACJX0J_032931, partial [Zea mays]